MASSARQIQKALAGKEDLLLGDGTVIQTRNGASYSITKLNADEIPYSGDAVSDDVVTIKEQIDSNTADIVSNDADIANLESLINVTNIAALVALTPVSDSSKGIYVTGFYTTGDGGDNIYYWDSAGLESTHNGGTIISPQQTVTPGAAGWWTAPTTGTNGVWVALTKGYVDVKKFGGLPSADNAVVFSALSAIDQYIYISDDSVYQISSDLTILNDVHVKEGATGGISVDSGKTLSIRGLIYTDRKANLLQGAGTLRFRKVTKTVGTAGEDYATIQAAINDCPKYLQQYYTISVTDGYDSDEDLFCEELHAGGFGRYVNTVSKSITGITLSGTDPVVVTFASHTFITGDILKFADIVGTTELNGNSYTITKVSGTQISLDDTDSSAFSAWSSAGTASDLGDGESGRLRIIGDWNSGSPTTKINSLMVQSCQGLQMPIISGFEIKTVVPNTTIGDDPSWDSEKAGVACYHSNTVHVQKIKFSHIGASVALGVIYNMCILSYGSRVGFAECNFGDLTNPGFRSAVKCKHGGEIYQTYDDDDSVVLNDSTGAVINYAINPGAGVIRSKSLEQSVYSHDYDYAFNAYSTNNVGTLQRNQGVGGWTFHGKSGTIHGAAFMSPGASLQSELHDCVTSLDGFEQTVNGAGAAISIETNRPSYTLVCGTTTTGYAILEKAAAARPFLSTGQPLAAGTLKKMSFATYNEFAVAAYIQDLGNRYSTSTYLGIGQADVDGTIGTSGFVGFKISGGNIYGVVYKSPDIVTAGIETLLTETFRITAISQADPCVITMGGGHTFVDGDEITPNTIVGMTELNGNTYTVANAGATTIELAGIDSSGYSAYASQGYVGMRDVDEYVVLRFIWHPDDKVMFYVNDYLLAEVDISEATTGIAYSSLANALKSRFYAGIKSGGGTTSLNLRINEFIHRNVQINPA